jgi:hypothetical protein
VLPPPAGDNEQLVLRNVKTLILKITLLRNSNEMTADIPRRRGPDITIRRKFLNGGGGNNNQEKIFKWGGENLPPLNYKFI